MIALKIALFLPSLRGGGAERVMLNLAQGFAAQGVQVDLVLAKAEGDYLNQIPARVTTVDLNSPRVLLSLPGLIKYLKREQPVAMLSAMGHANIVAVWAKKLAGVKTKLVASEHSTLSKATKQAQNIRSRVMPLVMRFTYPKTDAVVAVSKGVADDLAQVIGLPRNHIKVIYNPVVDEKLIQKASETLNHPWFDNGEPPVILAVGRLTEPKDYPTLLRTFALLREQRSIRLIILGEGEKRSELETLASELGINDDIAMPGFVENPYKYMTNAAVFVLSSKREGLPTVLIEAMSCGCPVVSTDCPSGPIEILENGKYGALVPVGDEVQLAAAIMKAIDSTASANCIRSRSMDFSVDIISKQYLKLLMGNELCLWPLIKDV